MKTSEEIKKIISRYKGDIKEKFKVKELGIFGSFVKSEQKNKSDIDILVVF